jgi:hypothetical protein
MGEGGLRFFHRVRLDPERAAKKWKPVFRKKAREIKKGRPLGDSIEWPRGLAAFTGRARTMKLLQLAAPELGRDITTHPYTDAVSRKDTGRAGDIALFGRFRMRRLVGVPLRRQLRRLPGDHYAESAR